jgi:cytochrome c-type biogenesis protein CcmH/NrfG
MSMINDFLYRGDVHVSQRVEAVMGQANQNDMARAEALFRQALRDPFNVEMDWLWLAAQVARPSQRRYCLQQALAINPRDEAVRRELGML